LDALPSVNGIAASQISPGDGVIVKPFVLGSVAVQESAVVADSFPAPSVNPFDQLGKILRRQLLNSPLDFLNLAHD
jgi:hypothetical protein